MELRPSDPSLEDNYGFAMRRRPARRIEQSVDLRGDRSRPRRVVVGWGSTAPAIERSLAHPGSSSPSAKGAAARTGPRVRRRRRHRPRRRPRRRRSAPQPRAGRAERQQAAAPQADAGPAAVPAPGLELLAGGARGDPLGAGRRDVLARRTRSRRSINFDSALASSPQRRAGVDADLRRPGQHRAGQGDRRRARRRPRASRR